MKTEYCIRADEVDANTFYIGKAAPASIETDAVWQIKKVIIAGNVTKILFAAGNQLFDKIWKDRVTYIYS